DCHPFADHALHAEKTEAELVLDELAHGPDSPVAQMIDVVGLASAVVKANNFANDGDQVIGREHALLGSVVPAESLVDLVAAHLAEVIASRVEEQRADQAAGVVDRGGVPGPQPPVELKQSLLLVLGARIAVQR